MNYSPFLHLILFPQKKEKTVHHFHMTIMHLVYPPRLSITIVFDFSWDDCCKIQGGGNKVYYGLCESGELY